MSSWGSNERTWTWRPGHSRCAGRFLGSKDPVFNQPKNGKGRSIRLTGAAVEALKRHKVAQNGERLRLGSLWEDNGLVFPGEHGQPMRAWSLTGGSFKRLLKRAELPEETRFHDLRHTCATLLLLEGVHPKFVQELLGTRPSRSRWTHTRTCCPAWGIKRQWRWSAL